MKTIKLLWNSVFFMLISSTLFAQTQMNYWALPPYKIDFTGASPTTSLLPGYNSAQFYGLTGVAFDNTGNLIVADYQNNAIRKVSPSGVVSTIAGNGTMGFTDATGSSATFKLPNALVLDAAQNIYVVDNGNNCIRKITPAGVVSTFAGNGTAGHSDATGTAASFNQPFGITIDVSGNLYVTERDNHCIRKITPAGAVSTFAGSNSNISGFADLTGTAARFYKPINITIDAAGNLYVTDNGNSRIRKITSAGEVTTIAGSGIAGKIDGPAASARFDQPFGIAVDASSNVYVSEITNSVIRKITPSGVVSTYAGTGVAGFADGPAATAKFQWPTGLTFDASGNLFIAENETHRVRKITPSGIVSTYAGTGVVGFVDTPADDYSVSNGAFDENGNVLFTIKDSIITDKLGVAIGKLNSYSQFISGSGYEYYTTTGKEISIVPVPGTCRDFYIIYTKSGATQWYENVKLLYTKVSVSAAGIVTIVPNFNGILVGSVGGSFMSIALSTLTSSNTRFIYALGKYSLTKYTISSSGISLGVVVAGYPPIATNDAKILELSPNSNNLAWIESTGPNTAIIHIYKPNDLLNPYIKLSISSITGGEYFGLEFSQDNSSLYFSASSSTAALGGIYKVSTLTTVSGPVTPTQIISGHYTNTELELGRDGFMYAIDGLASDDWYTKTTGVLGKINLSTNVYSPLSNILISSAKTNGSWNKIYMLPDQIDGENYSYFFGTPQLTSVTTINGSALNPTVPLNTYTCGAISLTNTASAATSYQITITKTDASGNVLTGTQAYSYSTGLISSVPPATIDIKALTAPYLATNIGYYKITFLTQNACASNTVFGLIYNSTMSLASANFKLNVGDGDSYFPNTILPGDTLSASGGTISGNFSTGVIATYKIKVDKVDCSSGAILTANIVNTPETAVLNGNPSNISAVSFNLKSVPKNYFLSNAGCFMVTYTVSNACGSSSQTGYFNSDPALYRLSSNIEEVAPVTNKIYPNPTNGVATVAFTVKKDNTVSLVLNNIQGGASYTVFTDKSASQGNNEITFDTSIMPAGIYVYQLSDGTDTFQTGKFVIIK